jgi:hypothetical protein
VLRNLPEVRGSGKPVATLFNERYKHFQTAEAQTTYVLGEFPWQVRVGDKAVVMDFISPPRMLSRESTDNESTWSLGEYMAGQRVWEAFQLPGQPTPAIGVFANQPSPVKAEVKQAWKLCLYLVAALFLLLLAFLVFSSHQEVFRKTYSFSPRGTGEPSFVTEEFELKGRPSTVEVAVRTNLSNNWAYFHFALINAETGEARDFAREVSYYFGRDSDGDWTEGRANDRAVIPAVPAGRYYLRVEPEMDANAPMMQYELLVWRDVPVMIFFWIAAGLLLVPPILVSVRALGFEKQRWEESDHPMVQSGDD